MAVPLVETVVMSTKNIIIVKTSLATPVGRACLYILLARAWLTIQFHAWRQGV